MIFYLSLQLTKLLIIGFVSVISNCNWRKAYIFQSLNPIMLVSCDGESSLLQ